MIGWLRVTRVPRDGRQKIEQGDVRTTANIKVVINETKEANW